MQKCLAARNVHCEGDDNLEFQLKNIKKLIDTPNEIPRNALLQRREALEHEIKYT